jgi:hypothetical protein
MAVNTSLSGLSQTAASNGPDGGADPPSALDDALRYHGAFIAQIRDSLMPIGSIIPYRGLAADLTANWKVCDGTAGTLDLRDKFIVGSGTTYALGATGGSKDAIAVSHTHTFSATTGTESTLHTHGVSDPGHAHSTPGYMITGGGDSVAVFGAGNRTDNSTGTGSATTGISLGTQSAFHTHLVSGTTAATGSSGTGANLPPYYALVYIERVS